jgi:hypothetical protein
MRPTSAKLVVIADDWDGWHALLQGMALFLPFLDRAAYDIP